MIVVSDSTPLIYLAALTDFDLLPRLFGEVRIPPAVWREVVDQASGFPVQEAVLRAGSWLYVTQLSDPPVPIPSLAGGYMRVRPR